MHTGPYSSHFLSCVPIELRKTEEILLESQSSAKMLMLCKNFQHPVLVALHGYFSEMHKLSEEGETKTWGLAYGINQYLNSKFDSSGYSKLSIYMICMEQIKDKSNSWDGWNKLSLGKYASHHTDQVCNLFFCPCNLSFCWWGQV